MNDAIKLMGLGCSIVGFAVAFIFAPNMPQAWGPFIAIFGTLLGVPIVIKAIRRKLGIQEDGGIIPTGSEGHATLIGWGDGVSFMKTDWTKISELCPNDEAIKGEMHYYKFGLALGRLTWALIIVPLLIRLIS